MCDIACIQFWLSILLPGLFFGVLCLAVDRVITKARKNALKDMERRKQEPNRRRYR